MRDTVFTQHCQLFEDVTKKLMTLDDLLETVYPEIWWENDSDMKSKKKSGCGENDDNEKALNQRLMMKKNELRAWDKLCGWIVSWTQVVIKLWF